MRKTLIMAALFVLFSAATAVAQTADFTGEWELDMKQSKLSPQVRFNNWSLKVSQSEKELKVESTTKGARGEQTGTEIYSLEGKETFSDAGTNAGRGTAALKASKEKDGKITLSSTRKINSQAGEFMMTVKDTWELAEEGKALKVLREINTPNGPVKWEMYFARK